MRTALLWTLLLAACDGKEDDSAPEPQDTDDSGTPASDEVTDPLSMPAEPAWSVDDFNPAAECATCHPTHYEQWSISNHAYAMVDPLFQALVAVRQVDDNGASDRFCIQCHSSIGTRGGEIVPGFSFEELSPIVMEGITCESCHKVTGIARDYNSGHEIDPAAPAQGPITDPVDNSYHASAASTVYEGSEFCGACHDVIEVSGLDLERPYREWLESPAADEGRNCQSCHMPTSTGPAAEGGPDRVIHDHRFVGVDTPAVPGFLPDDEAAAHAARVEALLTDIAAVDLQVASTVPQGEELDLVVTVANLIDGHNLPTGSTFIRELWLEVVATDIDGNVVFETGTLDANGDLRHYWSELEPYSDYDLVTFGSGLIDRDGEPTLFPWRATEHWSAAIPPLYDRTVTYFIPTAEAAAGPLDIQVRLRFRPLPPHLLRLVGLDAEAVPIYDLAEATAEVEVR